MKTIWSFDLGKASIGEAVRDTQTNEFLHKASLLIPAEFASTKDAATRRRMWRTRQAHKAREAWLDAVWKSAGLPVLTTRAVHRVEDLATGKEKWALQHAADYRMEREFAPQQFKKDKSGAVVPKVYREGRARDGAPAATAEDFALCYNSALLRIKLLRGEKLEPWQIYKALHSAIQKRGYGRVPWAAREVKRGVKSEEEIVAGLLKKDTAKLTDEEKVYRAAVEAWPKFKDEMQELGLFDAIQPSSEERKTLGWKDDHYFVPPCYYDARAMKLWSPEAPTALRERIDCTAASTRKVRFAREDVEKEIVLLANRAAELLPALAAAFKRWRDEGCTVEWLEKPLRPTLHFGKANTSKHAKAFEVTAKDFGAFLVHGPAGEPSAEAREDFAGYLAFRHEHGVHPGSTDDWLGATGQKTPRFDNRIINDCALISRLQVCGVGVRFDRATQKPMPESLLASEVTFLMKLKDTLVEEPGKQRKLTPDEVRRIFKMVSDEAHAVPINVKPRGKDKEPDARTEEEQLADGMRTWPGRLALRYALTKSDWKTIGLRPLKGHEEIKSPKIEGRSRFSRPALRLVRALILSGQKPSELLARLNAREPALLDEIGMDVLDAEPVRTPRADAPGKKFLKQSRPWVLTSDLKFLADLAKKTVKGGGDTWEDLHFPEQRLDALEARHTGDDDKVNVPSAVRELLGSINDPIVRHRLDVFAKRLTEHHAHFGMPEEIVLEFVREDFMGDDAKRDLAKFQKEREESRKKAREQADEAGVTERSGRLKYELFAVQGSKCFYCEHDMIPTALGDCEVDHIVPRSQGGPDAMVNYVLAHRRCNGAKGELTPFQWKHGREGWDAYVHRVESQATTLRNKKMQLLLREDAAELVQRYTALAETAWISRLAQKIASLHFGWRNGNDKDGVKRVTVISGGFTARIRRRYRLNSLLNPMKQEWFDEQWAKATKGLPLSVEGDAKLREALIFEWESVAEKNRADDRHHALDAMVINFWNTGAKKQDAHFFRFPDVMHKNPRGFFEKHIAEVMARTLAYEKAPLAETIYGGRAEKDATVIVLRSPLVELAMKPTAPGKSVFDLDYLRKKIKAIRDARIAEALLRFLEEGHEEEVVWRDFCAKLRLPQRDGTPGPRVVKVNMTVGASDEYKNLAKDWSENDAPNRGAFRKGKKGHKGQLIYIETTKTKKGVAKEIIQVRPVYAFESRATVERKLREEHGEAIRIYGFFQSGCLIAIKREAVHEKMKLPPGTYRLNTVLTDSKCMKLTTQDGRTFPDIPRYSLASLIAAGLRRAD